MQRLVLLACLISPLFALRSPAQSTRPADDAASLYLSAANLVNENYKANIMAPAASNLDYTPYPPYSAQWLNFEKPDFTANAAARTLAHQARSFAHATWPSSKGPNQVLYLNDCRALTNELADAAMYQRLQGNDAEAVESIRDLLHLSDLLENQTDKTLIRLLVGIGIRGLAMDRLNVISSNIALTKDAQNTNAVQISVARELIQQLLSENAAAETKIVVDAEEGLAKKPIEKSIVKKLIETANRVDFECDAAAMSLACHLYRFDTGSWPKSLADLRGCLPAVPIDPFGDGKQPMGYVVIKAGLPDGADRPLVYSRCNSKDGLFVLDDEPHYSFYSGDRFLPADQQKQGGQFRDVAGWSPLPGKAPTATTRPIE